MQVVAVHAAAQCGMGCIANQTELVLAFDQLIGEFLQAIRRYEFSDRRFGARRLSTRQWSQRTKTGEAQPFSLDVPRGQLLSEGRIVEYCACPARHRVRQ